MIGLMEARFRGPVPGSPEWPRRRWGEEILKPAWESTGRFYHAGSGIREKHFTHEGKSEYGYTPRKKRYQIRKAKRFGHTLPLVFSGETRDVLSRQARVRPTRSGVKVIYPRLNKLNFRHPESEVRMADEFRATSEADARVLAGHFDEQVQRRMDEAN